MPNQSLEASRALIDQMIENESVPDLLVGDITFDDLNELVQEVTSESLKQVLAQEIPENEQEDALRATMEQIGLKVALIVMNAVNTGGDPTVSIAINADSVTSVFTELLRQGATTVQLTVG